MSHKKNAIGFYGLIIILAGINMAKYCLSEGNKVTRVISNHYPAEPASFLGNTADEAI